MKILLVCCTLPPDGSATAALIDNLCVQFSSMGHRVDGITTKNSLYDPDTTPLPSGVAYHTNYVYAYRTRKKRFRDQIHAILKRISRKLHPQKKILYTESRVRALLREMKRRHAERYDVIVAVCAQYDALEAVLRFTQKRTFAGKTALYQVDPLSDNEVYASDGADYLKSYEQNAVKRLDYIFTTPIIYREKKNIWRHLCVEPLEFPALLPHKYQEKRKKSTQEIRCVFAGYLHASLRNPEYTLQLFASISDPRIHLYVVGAGYEEMLKSYEVGALNGRLHLLGQMSLDACNQVLEDADILINIGNSVANMTPSKIFNYIGFGKPILNIVRVEECPTLRYMEKYPLVKNISELSSDPRDATHDAEKWMLNVCDKYVSERDILTAYEECTPSYVAKRIIDIFENSPQGDKLT